MFSVVYGNRRGAIIRTIHPRDARLLAGFVVFSLIALAACAFGARQFERHLLAAEAQEMAAHWASILRQRFSDLDGLLRAGRISSADQDLLEFTSEAGRVFRYKVLNRNGVVVVASRVTDLGRVDTGPGFAAVVDTGGTAARVVDDEYFGAEQITVTKAYAPLMAGAPFEGAVEVYVDATARARTLRDLSDRALGWLAVILASLGIGCVVYVIQNARERERGRREVMQAQETMLHAVAMVGEKTRNPDP